MSIFFDYNPVTKVTQYFDYDPITDEISITSTQDVSKFLDVMKESRFLAPTKTESFSHYADIPTVVELELRKKGIKLEDRDATKRIIQEIETNYPYLKATNKKHG